MGLTRRNKIRAVVYSAALVGTLGASAGINYYDAQLYRRELEATYMRSLENVTTSVGNISTDLIKGQYIGTPAQMSQVSAKLWNESDSAKNALSALPLDQNQLSSTYRFLTQVGDYAMTMSRKLNTKQTLTEAEQQNIEKLAKYAEDVKAKLLEIESNITDNQVSILDIEKQYKEKDAADKDGAEGGSSAPVETVSFKGLDESLTDYPTLIYDGPFSDHILQKKPELTKNAKLATKEEAKKKAAIAATLTEAQLQDQGDENSDMPSYRFSADGTDVAVTKNGNFVSYLLKSREVNEPKLQNEEALKRAQAFLDLLGITPVTQTYYDIYNNILVVNFAGVQDKVTLYTDLIKVGVALDNGEIVYYDARGYITNHYKRDIKAPKISADEAAKSVSKNLMIASSKLALIPSMGLNELLTYEFKTKSKDNKNILVYVNAMTGAEEKILILLETETGVLTK